MAECRTWLSALLYDGENPVIKCIVTNSDGDPLLFESQKNALKFWKAHKDKFSIPDGVIRVKVTPQVVSDYCPDKNLFGDCLDLFGDCFDPDIYLFDLMDSEERNVLRAKENFILYSDVYCETEIMADLG